MKGRIGTFAYHKRLHDAAVQQVYVLTSTFNGEPKHDEGIQLSIDLQLKNAEEQRGYMTDIKAGIIPACARPYKLATSSSGKELRRAIVLERRDYKFGQFLNAGEVVYINNDKGVLTAGRNKDGVLWYGINKKHIKYIE